MRYVALWQRERNLYNIAEIGWQQKLLSLISKYIPFLRGENYMKIMIIRHGDPDYTIDSLTEKGWREAELLSQRLVKEDINYFYCSPLGRAKDTASPTLKKLGKEAEILDWLHEFRGNIVSPFTGKTRVSWDLPPSMWCADERYFDIKQWSEPELIANGNALEIYKETTDGVGALLEKYGWRKEGMLYRGGEDVTIALVCHCALGVTVMSYLLKISPVVAMHNFFLAPSSVTTIVTQTDKTGASHFRAAGVGDISHLYCAGEPASMSGLHPDFQR